MQDGFIIDRAVLQICHFKIAFPSFKSSQDICILNDVLICNCLKRMKPIDKLKIQNKYVSFKKQRLYNRKMQYFTY